MTQIRVLESVLALLEDVGIPHMLVGSFVSGFHGEFRATQDADVVIDPSVEELGDFLERTNGWRSASGSARPAAHTRGW